MLSILKNACQAFLTGQYSMTDLQGTISQAASAITSYEDRALCKYLSNAEARIDVIRVSNSESEAVGQVHIVAKERLQMLEELDASTWQRSL